MYPEHHNSSHKSKISLLLLSFIVLKYSFPILLTDEDDLVQKGYGWMLKVAGQSHQEQVFDYVMKNKKIMPRTSLSYAIEKMPEDLRKQAMKK